MLAHGTWSEFSGPSGAGRRRPAARGPPVSGLDRATADDQAALRAASREVAVFRASNFSVGVAALRIALRAALAAVPTTWDVEIVERHHRLKKDSPSGTALALADDIGEARSLPGSVLRHGRQGSAGPRPAAEVGARGARRQLGGRPPRAARGEGEWLELRRGAGPGPPLSALAAANS